MSKNGSCLSLPTVAAVAEGHWRKPCRHLWEYGACYAGPLENPTHLPRTCRGATPARDCGGDAPAQNSGGDAPEPQATLTSVVLISMMILNLSVVIVAEVEFTGNKN